MAHLEIVQRKPSFLKEAAIQIGAGGSAGFVEACIMHPMDLIKTRFQLQVKMGTHDTLYYTGIGDCMKKMYRNEGLAAFWKGILPPIIMETPKRAVKFFSFEQYKKFFNNHASKETVRIGPEFYHNRNYIQSSNTESSHFSKSKGLVELLGLEAPAVVFESVL